MATSNYNVNVTTTQAVAAMTRLQQSTAKVNAAFGGLKTAVGGLALGAAISSALRYADAINDIAEATGIGTANILGFSRAVAANGGSAESAQASILRLSQSIDDAATGSDKMRYQFEQVGISLQDLATLSEQDILNKTVAGLAKIEDNSKRIALATDILGKSARGINFKGVDASLPGAIAQSQKYAASQVAAAQLQDKLNYAIDQFRMSLLKALEPLIKFLNALEPEQIDRFVEAVVKIGGAAVAITGLIKVVEGLGKAFALLGGVFALYKSGMLSVAAGSAGAIAALAGLGKTATITASVLYKFAAPAWIRAIKDGSGLFGEMSKTVATLGKRLGFLQRDFGGLGGALAIIFGGLARVAAALAAVAAAALGINELIKLAFSVDPIDIMATKLEQLVTKYLPGVAGVVNKIGSALGMGAPPSSQPKEGLNTGSGPRGSIGTGRAAEEERKLNEDRKLGNSELDKRKQTLKGVTAEFAKQSRAIADAIVNEAGYINLSEDQVEVLKAQDEVYKRLAESTKDLREQKAALKPEEKSLIPIINAQIAALEKQAKVDANMIGASVQALQGQRLLELDRVANIERITAAMERQAVLADSLNQIRKEGNQAIADAEAEGAQAALTPLQRQIDVITRANQRAAQQAAESFAKQFEGLDMTTKQSQELADGLDLITQKYYKLTQVQVSNLNTSRSFATGWKKAFDEYVDAATNAAAKAERLFMKFTSGIEDALVDFVKTGKLNWKSFVADMAEELLRNQIKETIASFGQSLGLGSIFGGSAGGAAIGSSPSKPMYVVDISGGGFGGSTNGSGGGGSILDSILGGSKSGSSGGGFFDSILNVGKSIFGGIGDLFGGFFANGGMIPAGKFGIVGERGPEFVGGPASVTPMGGGSVVYNINATDAASFQALIARDPGFIHSVAELGRSRLPGARR